MKVNEKTYNAMPPHLQSMFRKLPNPGSDEVVGMFPVTGPSGWRKEHTGNSEFGQKSGWNGHNNKQAEVPVYADTGSAARFFYAAKASKRDRDEGLEGMEERKAAAMQGNLVDGQRLSGRGEPVKTPLRSNHHPTVKSTALMRWLCRLITPPGGVILDPFMGSGSTGKAAKIEGFSFIGIDLDADYVEIARRRIDAAQPEPAQSTLFEAAD